MNNYMTKRIFIFTIFSILISCSEKQFLFERFTKSSTSASLGVGLSLIKKIIEAFNWQITYSHKNNIHTFKIYL